MQAWLTKFTDTPKPFSRGLQYGRNCSQQSWSGMAPMPMALMSTPAVAPGWFVESVVGTTRGS